MAETHATNDTGANGFVRLHPDNPRYFLFRGQVLALVTATEHYGAVINGGFDYIAYLDMLQAHGFRLTRMLCFMREQETEFEGSLGRQNTLSARPGRYMAPWERSSEPGCYDGGHKFDLDRWNEAYFARLRDFCLQAGARGIIVEVTFFSQYYQNESSGPWRLCPLNAINNINGVGDMEYQMFTSLSDPGLVARQEALVRRVVAVLIDLDNIYYEICNEPNRLPDQPSAGAEAIGAWHNHLIAAVADAEAGFPRQHMIAVCERTEHVQLEHVSILNFHYNDLARKSLEQYRGLGRAVAFDETLSGIIAWNAPLDFPARRKEAWEFMFRGGSAYDYLDVTVATDDPIGTGQALFPDGQYYDGERMRLYLKYLNDFLNGLDLVRMKPDNSILKNPPRTATVNALAGNGGACALYLNGDGIRYLTVKVPVGHYHVEWFHPRLGRVETGVKIAADGGDTRLELPPYEEDLALRMTPV